MDEFQIKLKEPTLAISISESDGLADVLSRIRKATGLSQKALAERLEITPQYLCDLEHSRRLGSVEVVEAICDHYGNGPKWRRVLHVIAARGHGWDV